MNGIPELLGNVDCRLLRPPSDELEYIELGRDWYPWPELLPFGEYPTLPPRWPEDSKTDGDRFDSEAPLSEAKEDGLGNGDDLFLSWERRRSVSRKEVDDAEGNKRWLSSILRPGIIPAL